MSITHKFTYMHLGFFLTRCIFDSNVCYQDVYGPYFSRRNSLLEDKAKWHKKNFFMDQNSSDFKDNMAVFSNDLVG